MSNIIHYSPKDGMTHLEIGHWHNDIKRGLELNFPNEKYVLITAKGELGKIEGEFSFLSVDGNSYSLDEIIELIRSK
jgi:hypothetical protein